MPKFIITGDWHVKGSNPKARTDDYSEALMTKIYEVYQLAEINKAAAIIIPGDIFHSPNVSWQIVSQLAVLLQAAPCPVLAVPGNHDTYGHNLGSIPRTPYGLLSRLMFLRCLHGEHGWIFAEDVDGLITGHGFDTDTDIDLLQYGVNQGQVANYEKICNVLPHNTRSFTPFYIHVAHGMLLEKAPGIEMRHTPIADLANLPENLQPHVLICGHYHFGLPITRVGKTLVINPGALGRLTAHIEEIERPVQVALLTVNSPTDYDAEFIPLQCAKPGHEVLSRDHIEVEAEREDRIQRFLGLLAAGGEMQFLEVRDIIERIARQDDLPAAVVKDALARIGRARELLGVG